MCDDVKKEYVNESRQGTARPSYDREVKEIYILRDLTERREYLFRQLTVVQQAIDAVKLANNF